MSGHIHNAHDAALRPRLIVVGGPDPERYGDSLTLVRNETVTIGREAPHFGPAPLFDPNISTKHLEATVDGRVLRIRDLGSRNGLFVAGRRGIGGRAVQAADLVPGDALQIGATFLVFGIEPGSARPDGASLLQGVGPAMRNVRAALDRAVREPTPLLVQGPIGVGKRRIAQELHRLLTASGRSGPLVQVDCRKLEGDLAPVSLFGCVAGAVPQFPGEHPGALHHAHGGTLLLDAITALPLPAQAALHSALTEGAVQRVGGTQWERCEPRVICTSVDDVAGLVREGRFDADLFAVLQERMLQAPALRDRREDLAGLGHALLLDAGHPDLRISASLMWALWSADWPMQVSGLARCLLSEVPNAREGVLPRTPTAEAFLQAQTRVGRAEEERRRPVKTRDITGPARRVMSSLPSMERMESLLEKHRGDVEAVARELHIDLEKAGRWLEALELDPAHYR